MRLGQVKRCGIVGARGGASVDAYQRFSSTCTVTGSLDSFTHIQHQSKLNVGLNLPFCSRVK
jgi:hypothetical protein